MSHAYIHLNIMATCVSAAGKVLLAGGYLVLDQKYSGAVVSTSSRFYTVVEDAASATDRPRITVRSPQFKNAVWDYHVDVKTKEVVLASPET